MLLAIAGLGFAALRGSVVETRQVLGGLVGAAVLIGLVGSLVYALVVWTDAITNGLVHSHWGQRALGNWRDLGDAYGETTASRTPGTPPRRCCPPPTRPPRRTAPRWMTARGRRGSCGCSSPC